ncbi:hypothetical protein AB0J25_31070, partial [Streptomyces sp. NPDC049910]
MSATSSRAAWLMMSAASSSCDRPAWPASSASWAAACAGPHQSSTVLPHVSTVEAARDMDIFRSALGDEKLT